jgi:4-hydroxy-tetrahydrodipicolinate reductase
MKIALLGKGKTGSKVLDISKDEIEVFDRTNNPTFEKLIKHDVIISFLPGDAFLELIPLLVETKKPVVTGSTGFNWPNHMDQTLKSSKLTWIYASNFSLGVVAVKKLLETLHQSSSLFAHKKFTLHEVHHTQKKDAPSGTAFSMKQWLGEDCEITSERTGEVIGLHTLTLDTGSEKITITHEAKDRTLFAEGALWAANMIMTNKCEHGLNSFQTLAEGNYHER